MAFLAALPKAIAAMGTAHFEKHLADAAGTAVPHDFITMVRYSVRNPPCFLVHSHCFPSHLAELYLSEYAACDPYADHWARTRQPGVVALSCVSKGTKRFQRYKDTFLPQIGVTDEIGLMLPEVDGDSVALFYNKRSGQFTQGDIAALQDLFATAAELYRQHIRGLLLTGQGIAASPSLGRPLRLTSCTGATIWVTNEWRAQHTPDTVGTCTSIAGDFGLQDYFVWTLPPADGRNQAPLQSYDDWAGQNGLTPRERDIAALILQGHGNSAIADMLGLSVGNIKNHKRRIYAKLDITAERELFLHYFAAAAQLRPGTSGGP
ncbi:hypothetical protein RA19_17195 [Leisingera sp. ANG-M1]|uniref:helix-turn-helix domain-containing protein n=1 Tax=Leisingera sp. ANG-M1 TaxID=1577895 RepID=UPI00057C9C4C|nr:helix-turn-helix transcriptional regulator [Leisingera sp. ANG-M1]KIC09026.1 hypothetical protein RA19_17195 [Leisingera sp. ANG-M1]